MIGCICHPLHRCGRCLVSESAESAGVISPTAAPDELPGGFNSSDDRGGFTPPAVADKASTSTGNGSLKKRPAALVNTPAMADALQTASAVPTNDKPRCPNCKSPDLVPYKFGDIHDDVAAEYRARFPRARLCLDCLYCEWQPEVQ